MFMCQKGNNDFTEKKGGKRVVIIVSNGRIFIYMVVSTIKAKVKAKYI